jgi:putative transposase
MMRRSQQQLLDIGRYSLDKHRGGRPPGPRPIVLHRSRDDFPGTHPCHVTLRVRRGIPSLRKRTVIREIEATFRIANERKDFRLVHDSIQGDHAHLIVEAKDRNALGRGMKSLASRLAFAVNRALGRAAGKVLAGRYHLRILGSPRQVRNAVAYVLLNARRHAAKRIGKLRERGIVVASLPRRGILDAASSARWFPGWRRDVAVDRSPPAALGAEPAVAEPKTWLLLRGWRLHGLLDPNEIRAKSRRSGRPKPPRLVRRPRPVSDSALRGRLQAGPPGPATGSRESPHVATITARRSNPSPHQPFRLRLRQRSSRPGLSRLARSPAARIPAA